MPITGANRKARRYAHCHANVGAADNVATQAVHIAPQGKAPRLLGGEIAVSSTMNTTQFRLAVGGQSGFRFDNVSVHSRSLDVEGSTAHTYNSANQLVTSTTNGVVTNHTYDPWGRLSTRTRGAYTAGYEWRYGDKLKAVTSNFPGEAASVAYDYDGLGKRRSRTTGAGMTWWRWGLGWETLAEYTDPDTDGDIEGFSKFNVMMGMMHPLAEASVPSGQPPANAAYSYLALDHLSSTRAVFSQAKAQTAAMEFFPYGGRLSTSGTLPHHQFTAKPYDTGTGQYYFPYRYYAPAMARWTAADPAGTVDGPNVYGYVGGRVIGAVDIMGAQASEPKPEPSDPCKENNPTKCQECCKKKAEEAFESCRRSHPLNWYRRGLCNFPATQCLRRCLTDCLMYPDMTGKDAATTSDICNKITPSPENCPTK